MAKTIDEQIDEALKNDAIGGPHAAAWIFSQMAQGRPKVQLALETQLVNLGASREKATLVVNLFAEFFKKP